MLFKYKTQRTVSAVEIGKQKSENPINKASTFNLIYFQMEGVKSSNFPLTSLFQGWPVCVATSDIQKIRVQVAQLQLGQGAERGAADRAKNTRQGLESRAGDGEEKGKRNLRGTWGWCGV